MLFPYDGSFVTTGRNFGRKLIFLDFLEKFAYTVKQERQRRGGVRPGECRERSWLVQGFVNPERKVAPEPQS